MFITIQEIIDIIVMTFAIGYIFSGFVKQPPEPETYDPIKHHTHKVYSVWNDVKFGIMVAAPAIVLHELSHKFFALGFGASATLDAPELFGIPYGMYLLVIIMKMVGFPLLFFVGGYVSHTLLPPLQSAIVSIAGPLMNLALFALCYILVRKKLVPRKYHKILLVSEKLNMFLLIFNMLPIPGFDGYGFFTNILKVFV